MVAELDTSPVITVMVNFKTLFFVNMHTLNIFPLTKYSSSFIDI